MTEPALFVVAHGTRDAAGLAELHLLLDEVRARAPGRAVTAGFIELAEPLLDPAIDTLVATGVTEVVAVPLLLLGARHLKDDGPAALARARARHPGIHFAYGRELGPHPVLVALAEQRVRAAVPAPDPATDAVVLVGRGSRDPDANADLAKAARLLWDGRGLGLVEPAFVSVAGPTVPEALERCRRLGATRVTVVPFVLFAGHLIRVIGAAATAFTDEHPEVAVRLAPHLGPDPAIATLLLERYDEARHGAARMNCDGCAYRVALPGHEHEVGAPLRVDR